MNLSITESFLLLVMPYKGKLPSITADDNWLIAAGLLDLALSERADFSQDRIKIKGELAEELNHLKVLDTYLASSDKQQNLVIAGFSLDGLGAKKKQLLTDVSESLAVKGATDRTTQSSLLGSQVTFPPKTEVKQSVVEEMRANLLEGEVVTDSLALAMLLHKSGHLKRYFSDYERVTFENNLVAWKLNPEIETVAQVIDKTNLVLALSLVFLGAN